MDAMLQMVLQELRGAWRFRRYALGAAWAVCLAGWAFVFTIPESYEARARVFVDTRTALKPLLQGLAVDQDVDSQLNMVRQALLSRPNLQTVARETDLDLQVTTPAEREALIDDLTRRITITMEPKRDETQTDALYNITYTNTARDKAVEVVSTLLNSFVEDTLGGKRSGAESAQQFLREQLASYETRLAEAESRLADFKKQNVGLVPGEQGDYFQRLQTEMQEVRRVEAALAVATSRRAELDRQLRGEIPFVQGNDSGSNRTALSQSGSDTTTRIRETQARLDDLLLRFTDRHPEVIAAKENLAELDRRRSEELAALKRGDASAAALSGAGANPVYQSIQLALNQADSEIAALRGELNLHQRTVNEFRSVVDTVPEVEAQFARLNRDYDVTKAQYNALLDRLEKSRISEDAEETGSVKFEVIEPPSAKLQPVSPKRPLLLAGVLLAGLGVGGAIAYLLNQLRPVFMDGDTLEGMTGLPVLGVVSMTWMDRQRAELRTGYLRYAGVVVLLFLAFGLVVALHSQAARLVSRVLA